MICIQYNHQLSHGLHDALCYMRIFLHLTFCLANEIKAVAPLYHSLNGCMLSLEFSLQQLMTMLWEHWTLVFLIQQIALILALNVDIV